MDRLTERNTLGEALLNANLNEKYYPSELIDILLDRLAAYEDTGLSPEEVEATKAALMGKSLAEIKELNSISVERMIELAKAEAEGRLVVLPCKVGDIVYRLGWAPCHKGETAPDGYCCCGCEDECDLRRSVIEIKMNSIFQILETEFGRRTFLSREEAEKALEAQK